jgi:DNA repair protein RecN (Recombination protein N)
MLSRLEIDNIVLIDHLTLDMALGLTVLTGETGAGKSILLDALGLLKGDRADIQLIRAGADDARVRGVFDVASGHPVWAILADADVIADAGEPLILSRVLSRDGKSKAYVNNQIVSVSLIRALGAMLIDIHGQFETSALFMPAYHRDVLDRFGGLLPDVSAVRAAYHEWMAACAGRDEMDAAVKAALRDEGYIRDCLAELEKLAPQVGEEQKLLELKQKKSNQTAIIEGVSATLAVLSVDDDGAENQMARATRTLDRLRPKIGEKVDEWLSTLDEALASIRDISGALEDYMARMSDGYDSPEAIDDRLYELRRVARKHDCTVDELSFCAQEFDEKIQNLNHMDLDLAAKIDLCQKQEAVYIKMATDLHQKRLSSAARFDRAIMGELGPLKLDKATFKTQIDFCDLSDAQEHGMDRIRFMVAMNTGSDLAPLEKVASGGELSRMILAMKVMISAADQPEMTRIFDEVDSGVGGAVAAAMADRLFRLSAKGRQVFVVTHAPQVAAMADHHLLISKKTQKGMTTTSVETLDSDMRRREELARMLSGAEITDEARAAAQKLMDMKRAA